MSTPDFFRSRLDAMIDLHHPLAVLGTSIEARLAQLFERRAREVRGSCYVAREQLKQFREGLSHDR